MLIFNYIGLGIALTGVLIMSGINSMGNSKTNAIISFLVLGLWMLIIDLVYRVKFQRSVPSKKLIHPKAGGHFFFIPVWLISIGPIIFAIMVLINRK